MSKQMMGGDVCKKSKTKTILHPYRGCYPILRKGEEREYMATKGRFGTPTVFARKEGGREE